MIRKDGEPAFPTRAEAEAVHGMSLRDYFAGQALGGLVTQIASLGEVAKQFSSEPNTVAAKAAYEFADAMLAARAKEEV